MNLPNKLTVLRIFLVPLLVVFLLTDSINDRYIYALVVFSAASLTDFMDGRIARSKGLVTTFGKFADPLADKCLVISALICFLKFGSVSALAVVMTVLREFTVTAVRMTAAEKGKVVPANFLGKAKTIGQIAAVMSIIILSAMKESGMPELSGFAFKNEITLSFSCGFLVWLSVLLSWVSGGIYIFQNRELIQDIE